jgi:hypothetical protein
MQVWKGWTTADAAIKWALTWSEWCARHQRTRLLDERHQVEGMLFSEWELAHLSFARWLYQTGRLGLPAYDQAEREAV